MFIGERRSEDGCGEIIGVIGAEYEKRQRSGKCSGQRT
jgi:hypothetical protein